MNTVIEHIEYKIKSLSEALIQCNEENKQFKKDWSGIVECGNYEITDKVVIKNYISEIAEYEQALIILTSTR